MRAQRTVPDWNERLRAAGWLTGAGVASLLFTLRDRIDPDYWWHVAIGRMTIAHGIPTAEPFSFLPAAHPWDPQQWAFEVLLTKLDNAGATLAIMGILATLAIVIAACATPRAHDVSPALRAAVVMLSAVVVSDLVGARGLVFTMLGTAITLWVIRRWREGSTNIVWVLPPLLAAWANLHAGFIVGLVIPITSVLVVAVMQKEAIGRSEARIRPLLIATGMAALATLINPAGPRVYAYIAETLTTPGLTHDIAEWQSPDFHMWLLRLFEVEVMALVGLWTISRRPDPLDVVTALGTVVAALLAERNVVLFVIVAAPQLVTYGESALTIHLPGLRGNRTPPALVAGTGVLIALVCAAVVIPRVNAQSVAAAEQSEYPAAAVTYVADRYSGQRIYTREAWGGYLAYRIPSGRVVFMYDALAVFGNTAQQRYDSITLIEATWQTELARDHMSVAIVPRNSQEASILIDVGWNTVFTDAHADALVLHRPGWPKDHYGAPVSPASPRPSSVRAMAFGSSRSRSSASASSR